jgi:general stress protein YciG
VAKEDRGFASMDRTRQREIASKGGRAAHQKGRAHEWTSEEAREAGRKGGMASQRRKQDGFEPDVDVNVHVAASVDVDDARDHREQMPANESEDRY